MICDDLLYKIADKINGNSNVYRAMVPQAKKQYVVLDGNGLTKTSCPVLNIIVNNKPRNHKSRSFWFLYKIDIDKVIRKISRKDKDFSSRIDKGEPSLFDIEIIVRRASYQALKLKLVKTSFDLYTKCG